MPNYRIKEAWMQVGATVQMPNNTGVLKSVVEAMVGGITIAALQIASINLGEVKTLFFDASYLDRNSLAEVNAWANKNDFQLLIERPDFDGGEIKYELIENAVPAKLTETLFN